MENTKTKISTLKNPFGGLGAGQYRFAAVLVLERGQKIKKRTIYNASGELARCIAENKPDGVVLKGSQLRQVLKAAGYEIKTVELPQGLLRRRKRQIATAEVVILRGGEQYPLEKLTLRVSYDGSPQVDDEEGYLIFTPTADLTAPTPVGFVDYGSRALAEAAGYHEVRLELPEMVVELPVPEWTWAVVDDYYSSHAAVGTKTFFESEARELAKKFVSELAGVGLIDE